MRYHRERVLQPSTDSLSMWPQRTCCPPEISDPMFFYTPPLFLVKSSLDLMQREPLQPQKAILALTTTPLRDVAYGIFFLFFQWSSESVYVRVHVCVSVCVGWGLRCKGERRERLRIMGLGEPNPHETSSSPHNGQPSETRKWAARCTPCSSCLWTGSGPLRATSSVKREKRELAFSRWRKQKSCDKSMHLFHPSLHWRQHDARLRNILPCKFPRFCAANMHVISS